MSKDVGSSPSDTPGDPGLGVAASALTIDGCPDEGELAMNDRPDASRKTGNLLLDALTVQDRELLLAEAKTRPITVGDVLLRPGDRIAWVPFPISGSLSMITQPDDMPVEAATIGREGAASVHSALGSQTATQDLVSQIEGEMITVPVQTFTKQAQEGRLQDI